MQIKKAGVVATGALATVAVMGAPAAAAPHMDATAFTKASTLNLGRGGGWDAPWDQPAQSAISIGSGSVAVGAAWQICGSAAMAGVGGTLDAMSPNTIFGDCNNGNTKIKQDTLPAVISVLDDSVLNVAVWQACGSTAMGGVGGTVSLMSPSTVVGDCKNGNVIITHEKPYEESTTVSAELVKAAAGKVVAGKKDAASDARKAWATRTAAKTPAKADKTAKAPVTTQARHPWSAPWDQEPQSAISVGQGSVASGATWQLCGGEAVWGVGGVLTANSPATVWGDCDNANVWIDQQDPKAVISVLDNSRLSLADWQVCGSTTVSGVGGTANLGSPDTVFGNCNNANTVID